MDAMILTRLRKETRPLHEAVELAVGLQGRLRSIATYADLLARFYGLHAPLEMQLTRTTGYEELGIRLSERNRSALIVDDLLTLGWSSSEVQSIPLCSKLPETSSLDRALGCLYVLEGSTLGGSIICREVQLRLGSSPGRSFFAGYGDRTGMMWNAFRDALRQYSDSEPQCGDGIVAAASATFDAFREWLPDSPSRGSKPGP
jgi:heme oxygenase (biliverdin-IX-beta and delta-forming)